MTSHLLSAVRRRPVLVVVAVAGALRLAWALFAARNVPVGWMEGGDQFSYWYYGNEIARGRGYISYITHQATAYYPIGYTTLLAVLYGLQIHTPLPDDQALSTALLHVALGTASVALLYIVGKATVGGRIALAAAAAYAVYPSAIFAVATYALETAYITSALAALAILVTHDWASGPPSWRRLLSFAVTLSVSVVIRPFSLPMVVALVACYLVARVGWRELARGFGVVVAVLVVAVAPWTLRNAARFDAFLPFSTNLGDTMCMSRFPGSDGGFAWADHEYCMPMDTPEVARNRGNIEGALRFVEHHPVEEVRQWFLRLRSMMSTDQASLREAESLTPGGLLATGPRLAVGWVTDMWFALTLALSVPGVALAVARHRRSAAHVAVLVTTAALLLIPLGLWGNPRFHAPLVPFMCLFAALAASSLSSWVARRTPGRSASSAAGGATAQAPVG